MKKWNLVVDLNKCNGCFNCFLSAKDEHVGNDYPGYAAAQPLHGHAWINIEVHERGQAPTVDLAYLPTMCNHCDNAPCIAAGKGAIAKRGDGIVIIDPVKAKGRRDLVSACPYGSIWWNEELKLPQAWTFDAHLLDRGWPQPRCAQACGTGAIKALNIDDAEMSRLTETESLDVLKPELGTQPRVYYKNLHRATRTFVSGTITGISAGIRDVVASAAVTLVRDGVSIASAESDAFGEFRIDNLMPNSGRHSINIHAQGWQTQVLDVDLGNEACCLGEIELRCVSPR